MTMTSNDIGILGMEAYFPRYFVEQKELGNKLISLDIL